MVVNGISPNVKTNTSEIISNKDVENMQKENIHNDNIDSNYSFISDRSNPDYITYDSQNKLDKNELIPKDGILEEELCDKCIDQLSEEDYGNIEEEDLNLEEYTIDQLERAIMRIKSQRITNEQQLEDIKEQLDLKLESVKNMIQYSGVNKKIIESLVEANLPITEANILKISNAVEMAQVIGNMSDKTIHYMIKNNLDPTTMNLYKAEFSGNFYEHNKNLTDTFDSLKSKIQEVITNAGFPQNETSLDSAKWLLDHNLPVTEDTLWQYKNLQKMKENITDDVILEKAIKALAEGNPPESANLEIISKERAEQEMKAFHSITDEAVTYVISKKLSNWDGKINCDILLKGQKYLDNIQASDKEDPGIKLTDDLDIKSVIVRRKLEQIRLKMTVESGQQLIKSGYHLKLDDLSKIINGLQEIEDGYYKTLLQERNAAVTNENINNLKLSIQGIEELKTAPCYILGTTLNNRNYETINGLLIEGAECKKHLERTNSFYETLMTSPRTDLGDSIQKAFRNVDAILTDMNLSITTGNQRAVRILGYNNIPITEENMGKVKVYDEKVNYMLKNLHPAVTTQLIKEGINPLNLPMDELNNEINRIKDEIGITRDEKYSKFLWKLEKDKGINEEEKKSFIGIYRLLHMIEKTDGAPIGAVLKADQEVTMNSLLTAVRIKEMGGIHNVIDDAFGTLEELKTKGESISSQIDAAFNRSGVHNSNNSASDRINTPYVDEKLNYHTHTVRDILDNISPDKLQQMEQKDIYNLSLEEFRENLNAIEDDPIIEQQYITEKLSSFRESLKSSKHMMKLLSDLNLPTTIRNLEALKDTLSENDTVFKQLKQYMVNKYDNKNVDANKSHNSKDNENISEKFPLLMEDISDQLIQKMTDSTQMNNEYEAIEQHVNQLFHESAQSTDITADDIKAMGRISNGLAFLKNLANRESYQIPIVNGNKLYDVNVTFIKNLESSGKVSMEVYSDDLGKIDILLTVEDLKINGLITCDNRKGLSLLEKAKDEIHKDINGAGIEVEQLNFGIDIRKVKDNRNPFNYYKEQEENLSSNVESEASKSTLYQVAKNLILRIQVIEGEV